MTARRLLKRLALVSTLAIGTATGVVAVHAPVAQAASEVRAVVNREAITSYQIQQRAAFRQLRREAGGADAAMNELIDEALKKQEIRRRGINVPDAAVDQAFANFAQQNRLTVAQLGQVLGQAGFSQDGFKDYIRTQMGWGQAIQANMRQGERLTEQDAVQRMLQQGGQKPTTTEYTLQQVIFVVPQGQRGQMANRKAEANALRQRFSSCPATYEFARGLRDVTVRELGRVAQPELPQLWKADIEALQPGRATPVKETERGVEFIAVCESRNVSDDRTAALVFEAQDLEAMGRAEPDAAFLKTLKDRATIVRR